MIAHRKLKLMSSLKDLILTSSDEPELEFSGSSWAELGHFNFWAERSLTEIFLTHFFPKFLSSEVLYHDLKQFYDHSSELLCY